MTEIIPVTNSKSLKKFVDFPFQLYAGHPYWVPPLKKERHNFLNPKKNPFFKDAEVQLFLAVQNSKTVGRISAHVNHRHNKRYQEKTGHFGFFDCVEDKNVAELLLQTAETWLKEKNMEQAQGPFSFSTNDECGLLVKGFDSRPYPLTPYNYDYYASLLENLNYKKIKDLIAWSYDMTQPLPEATQQIADFVKTAPGLTIREIDFKNMERDIRIISDVFNSAWSNNWGFLPWTEEEIQKIAKDLRTILDPKIALIAEVDGKPAAISIALPNFHEAIFDLRGKLFPFGIFKLLYRIKTHKIKTARQALLGIKKEYRRDQLAGLSVLLYSEMHHRGKDRGYTGGELSWTLEDNEKINNGLSLLGGIPYKTFRIYGKKL